jgi:hypothetical protein
MTLFLYIFLGLLIATIEFRRRRKDLPIDAMTVFNCYYIVLYALMPINVLFLGEDVVRQKYAYETFGNGNAYTALALLVSYLTFCLGYWVKSSKSSNVAGVGIEPDRSIQNGKDVAVVIFFLGLLTTIIYVIQVGGISQVVSMAMEVRSGEFVIESKYIFYRHFSQFSADAFTLFSAVLIGKKVLGKSVTRRDKIFLLASLVLFVYYAASTGGRRPFIYPIILCFLVALSVGMKVKKWAVVALAVIFIFAGLGSMLSMVGSVESLPALVELTSSQENASWPALFELAYDNATQGLADSFIHFVGAQKASLWQFGFLTDIVNLPNDLLPSQLLGFQRTTHMHGEVNLFFMGYEPEEGSGEGENLGLHGYLLVNFGYWGMFTAFFFLGMLYKWLHLRFRPADSRDTVRWLVYWWVVLAFFVYFREGLLLFVIKLQLTWWITIAALAYLRSRQLRNLRSANAIAGGGFGSSSVSQA